MEQGTGYDGSYLLAIQEEEEVVGDYGNGWLGTGPQNE